MVPYNMTLWYQIKRYGLTVKTRRIVISNRHVCTVIPQRFTLHAAITSHGIIVCCLHSYTI